MKHITSPMKHSFLFIGLIAVLMLQCRKEPNPLPNGWKGPQQYGWAKGERNGEIWEGGGIWLYTQSDSSKIALHIGSFNQDTVPVEEIFINNIPLKKGVYPIEEKEPSAKGIYCLYYLLYVDVPVAGWTVAKSPASEILIQDYDELTHTVRGRLHLYLKDYDDNEWPSSVKFTDLQFEIRKF